MPAINRVIAAGCQVVKKQSMLPGAAQFNGQKLAEFSLDPRLTRRKLWMHISPGGAFQITWNLSFYVGGASVFSEDYQQFNTTGIGQDDNYPGFSTSGLAPCVDSYIFNNNSAGNVGVIVSPMIFDPLEADKCVLTGGRTSQPGGNVIFYGLRVMSLAPL